MSKRAVAIVGFVVTGALGASPAGATIIGVTDLVGSIPAGTFASILSPGPALVRNAGRTNTGQEGFDERQNVLVPVGGLAVDAGSIAAGTLVDSHMIFLNQPGSGTLTHFGVQWSFSGPILGVMSDGTGALEAASNALLGLPGTNYESPFTARGMEAADSYVIAGNQLTVNMRVSQPGDWIRVVTAPAPEPGTLLLLGSGLALVALRRRLQG